MVLFSLFLFKRNMQVQRSENFKKQNFCWQNFLSDESYETLTRWEKSFPTKFKCWISNCDDSNGPQTLLSRNVGVDDSLKNKNSINIRFFIFLLSLSNEKGQTVLQHKSSTNLVRKTSHPWRITDTDIFTTMMDIGKVYECCKSSYYVKNILISLF